MTAAAPTALAEQPRLPGTEQPRLPGTEQPRLTATQAVAPGAWEHLLLLWQLRVTLARGALAQRAAALPALGGLLVVIVSTALAARATNTLFSSDAVDANAELALFLTLLLGFLASTLWITWPVVTASVDDAAELSRFALFPVAPKRLFLASVLAGLVEPRTLPVWGALLGAAHGLARREDGHFWLGCVATALLALFCVVWGRVGLHLLLNLFRHRRSAEAMGGGLLLLLACTAFVPPPDLSWLRQLNAAAPQVNDAFLRGAIATFSLLPTGGWAWMVFSDAAHEPSHLALPFGYLVVGIAAGYQLAFALLVRFHRRAGRSLPQRPGVERAPPAYQRGSLDAALLEREWRDVRVNPRARLMIALPFFLTILVKLVGARGLALVFIGPDADAWLAGGVASYGALVLGAGFAQNSFGYDGAGAQLFFSAPVTFERVLRAKNLVHGGLALALGLTLIAFYSVYIAWLPAWLVFATACNAAFQALLFVGLGNVLSVVAPRKFHPSLKRRDRASALATGVGLVVAMLAIAPGARLLRGLHGLPPTVATLVGFALLPVMGWALWRASGPLAARLLETRRPELLRAVARE